MADENKVSGKTRAGTTAKPFPWEEAIGEQYERTKSRLKGLVTEPEAELQRILEQYLPKKGDSREERMQKLEDLAMGFAGTTKLPTPKLARASEVFGPHEGKTAMFTETDRTKVGGGFLGGPGFSSLQLELPAYEGKSWGVASMPKAQTIIRSNQRVPEGQAIWSTYIGHPEQHRSNQMVFDQILNQFRREAKKGNLPNELRESINERLAAQLDANNNPIFPPDVDIMGKNFRQLANTFDRRAAAAEIMGGKGVGGKKGSIIDYPGIIESTTDPALVDAPTWAVGPRVFTLTNEVGVHPELHPAFPYLLHGEDLGKAFNPVPHELAMKDLIEKVKREKGRKMGYMDLARGYAPQQFISEEWLTALQKAGYADGGLAQYGLRHSGESVKGKGYFGPMVGREGTVTELSAEDESGEFPLVVPTLTAEELELLLAGKDPTAEMMEKASSWAATRRKRGESPFASPTEVRMPRPKAEGGPVNLTDLPDEVTPANWREHLQNNVLADARALLGVKDGGVINLDELIEKSLKKKDGGVINLDELIDWTLAKAEHRKMKEGGAVKMADGGQTFPLQRPEEVTDLKPRPRTKRDELLEMLSKGVGSVHEFMAKPFGYENPPGEMVSSLIGLPGAAKTLERMAYGDPLTSGAGMTTNLLPETTEAAMLALGAAPTVLKATKNLPVGLSIKPKGGNWLTGDIEQALKPLRSRVIGEEPAERLKKLEDYFADQRAKGVALDYSALDRERARMAPDVAINRWIDTKLNKYIRNEMATPEDPVRALAEQGVTHLPFDVNNYAEIMLTGRLGLDRMRAGFPVHGMGETPAARVWERATDATIRPRTAGEQLRAEYPFNAETMPWLEKLDPETPVYSIPSVSSSDLGFEHLIDELKTAMSPTSDLPNNLRFDPKDIDKLTVPQAVERVSKINSWRAEQAVKAEREGMMANLKAEPRLADENLQLSFVEKPGGAWVDIPETVNKEGVQLCTSIGKAGGWCTMHDERALDYGSGENRLTALLDTEGRPHAQAKITENEWPVSGEGFAQLDSGTKAQYGQYVREWRQRNPEIEELTDEDVIQALKEAGVRGPLPDITELKPPGNSFGSKRSQEYIKRDPEYRQKVANSVLNFLNSGEWGHVSDLDHYNIIDLQSPSNVKNALADNLLYDLDFQRADKFNAAFEANPNAPRFMTQEQFRDFLGDLGPTGFAKGGRITKSDLEREYRMAFGGGVFNTDPDITDSGRIIPHNI